MFDSARLVFIDETSANTKMVRLHGRCVRGSAWSTMCRRATGRRSPLWPLAPAWHESVADDRRRNDGKEVLMPFSKLKAYLRKAGERTIPRLRRRIGFVRA
jgi:hypothetical protein